MIGYLSYLAVSSEVNSRQGGGEGVCVPEMTLNLAAEGVKGVLLDVRDLRGQAPEVNN